MAISKELFEQISNYIVEDEERAGLLFDLDPSAAAEKLNAAGISVTADDLSDFGSELQKMTEKHQNNDELDEDALEDVAGGSVSIGKIILMGIRWIPKWPIWKRY